MLKKRLTALLTAAFLMMSTIPVCAKPLGLYLRSKTNPNEVVYMTYTNYMKAFASRNKIFRDVLAKYDIVGVSVENDDDKKIKVIDYSKYTESYTSKKVKNMDDYADNEDAVVYKNPEKIRILGMDGTLSEEKDAPDKPAGQVDYINIGEARGKSKGEKVTVKGIVSGVIGNNAFIQDGTAGIYIYMGSVNNPNLKKDNIIKVTGTLDEFNGLKQIKYIANEGVIEYVEPGIMTKPQEITASDIGEAYESELITVKNLTITSVGTGTSGYDIKAKDGNDNNVNIRVDKYLNPYIDPATIKSGSIINVTALVSEFTKTGAPASTYQLMVRGAEDIVIVKEGSGEVPPSATKLIRDIQGKAHRSPLEGQSVAKVKGIVTAISSVDKYQKGFFMQDVNPDNDPATSEGIFVKYSNLSTVKMGDMVEVDGAVSEVVNGTNKDGAPETLINAVNVTVNSSGNKLPQPIAIELKGELLKNIDNDELKSFNPEEDAMDYFESLEGMLVKVKDPLIVGAAEKYGEIYVVPNKGVGSENQITVSGGIKARVDDFNPEVITIDDIIKPIVNDSTKKFIDPNLKIKTGDKFASDEISGVMSYGFGKYKFLNIDNLPAINPVGRDREVTLIQEEDNKITVASYNIENFHKGVGERINELAKTIVSNLKTPDIIGLIEVQDNNGAGSGTTDASESYKALITAIQALGGPEYEYTDVAPIDGQDGGEPGGNIRPGFIYKKGRVTLLDKEKGTANVGVTINNNGLSVNPGRIDPTNPAFSNSRKPQVAEFEFKGQKVFVIANHLNSKGGDGSLFGINQPAERSSEIQRHEQAKVINNFIKDLQAKVPNANVVALGDLNDFEFSDTLKLLKGNEMINMIEELPENQRFTYNFGGNSQVLDHILVSNNLREKTIVDIVNVNSQFTEGYGRVSDHDPVLVQMDLGVKIRSDKEILDEGLANLTLGNISAVTSNLNLPSALGSGVTVAWKSNNEAVISNNGSVTRPEVGQSNAVITLTATLTKGLESVEKVFEVTVVAKEPQPEVQPGLDLPISLKDMNSLSGSGWSGIDLLGTTYIQMLKSTSSLITPGMDFSKYSTKALSFKARTYGGVDASANKVTVSISVDNGEFVKIKDIMPANTTLTLQDIDLTGYSGKSVRLKFETKSATGSKGAGISDISIVGTN